jgi:hypothetical protein
MMSCKSYWANRSLSGTIGNIHFHFTKRTKSFEKYNKNLNKDFHEKNLMITFTKLYRLSNFSDINKFFYFDVLNHRI